MTTKTTTVQLTMLKTLRRVEKRYRPWRLSELRHGSRHFTFGT